MIKILFICHGNICRSPMAEFFMKDIVAKKGLSDSFYIESAATSREELGNGVYPPAKRILSARGIDCKNKFARQVTKADYQNFDYLVCMDKNNLRNLAKIIGEDYDNKVSLLLQFAGINRDIADPWYTGDFSATERDVKKGCNALLEHILNKVTD